MLGCETLPSRMMGLPAMSASVGLVVSCSVATALVAPGASPGHNEMVWTGSAAQTCAVKRIPQPRLSQTVTGDFMRAVTRIPRQVSNVILDIPGGIRDVTRDAPGQAVSCGFPGRPPAGLGRANLQVRPMLVLLQSVWPPSPH